MIKSAGLIMIVSASLYAAGHIWRTSRQEQLQLQAMIDALLFLRGELSGRLRALPDIFRQLSAASNPQIAAFFSICADHLGAKSLGTLSYAFHQALVRTPGLLLTDPARNTLRELASLLGRQDLAGSLQLIDAALEQLRAEQQRLRSGGAERRRSCAAVCVCAGFAAAVILI